MARSLSNHCEFTMHVNFGEDQGLRLKAGGVKDPVRINEILSLLHTAEYDGLRGSAIEMGSLSDPHPLIQVAAASIRSRAVSIRIRVGELNEI